MNRPTRKKEGWLGIALTAMACAAFLWWWMTPEAEPPPDVRDPETWLDDAARLLPPSARSLELDYDLLFLARSWHADGVKSAATRAAGFISSPVLREVATADLPPPENPPAESANPADPVGSRIVEARAAYDQLEFDRGRELVDGAERLAADQINTPAKVAALARVAAARYQLAAAEAARATMHRISAEFPNSIPELPVGVILEFAATDALPPCLEWLSRRAPQSPGTVEVARELVRTIDDRVRHRETGELAVHGGAADPGAPPDAQRQRRIEVWSFVGANDVSALSRLRAPANSTPNPAPDESAARTALAVARAFLWHRTPAPPPP
jgi:hypothetical protein